MSTLLSTADPSIEALLPPGPSAPPLAQMLAWGLWPTWYLDRCHDKFGEVFSMRFPGFHPEVLFSNPAHIKEIFTGSPDELHAGELNAILEPLVGASSLLILDGQRHRAQRKLLLPPFHGERMRAYGETMQRITDAAIDRWTVGGPINAHREMQAITLEVIMQTVFGVHSGPYVDRLRRLLIELLELSASPLLLIKALQRNLGPLTPWARSRVVRDEIDQMLFAEFARRRKDDCEGRTDILSMLITARDEHGEAMTNLELRDEMITLLAAGHETTATALSWAIYRVQRHPDVRKRLTAEVAEVIGDGPVTAEHLPHLTYLEATVKETLRLNPVVPDVGRVLKRSTTIGGHDLPAGAALIPVLYLTHRRPDVWDDPLTFRPERFIDRKIEPYSFLPFGGGTRRCIGAAFAMYELKIVLAQLLNRTELSLPVGYEAKVVRRSITFSPKGGVDLTVVSKR